MRKPIRPGIGTQLLVIGWSCVLAAAPQHPVDEPAGSPDAQGSAVRSDAVETAKRFIASGTPDRAVEILRRVVAAQPDSFDACLLLGTALVLVSKRSEALEVLNRAVDLRPDSAQAHLMLGNALARFSEIQRARQAYEKALALEPGLVMAHLNLGMLLAGEEELAAARVHFSQCIDLLGNSADAARPYYLRGKVLLQQNLPAKAEQDFVRAVQLRPEYAEAYLELGVTRGELQNESGALQALQRAVEIAPDDAQARYQFGSHLLRAGKAPQAVEQLEAANRLCPDDRELLYALARALGKAGRMEKAEPLIKRLADSATTQALHDPDVLRAGELNNTGIALEKEGNYAAALERYRTALNISPKEIGFRKNLALVLCRLGRWDEAVVQLREVLQAAPGDADAGKALFIALEKINRDR